ncbi:hypothetical protein N7530_009209 [Penicillium desertorum]|uniref:MTHFR SAM-binding regulatory domain-containing protein n=1 Tax=Penicillium desertorum TaxID=1303715 RepID=A0A9W9WI10_9EURO|nr:hypothetical protein N7530_009209 [Penicillium desertorum]
MHIREKLAKNEAEGKTGISFEFFPPKTAQGVQNLYDRMDRMHGLGPSFIDITWGAGGRLSDLTCEMVSVAQSVYGLETCMHLTCTDMPVEKVDQALQAAYKAGCTNILALRGDPPREKEAWEAAENGFCYAKDLVKYIREKYGNHFDIGVGGYPEGADDNTDVDQLIDHLKEKVDAGSSFVVTQMFYDVDNFIEWVKKCRAKGINVPIIPGIMPIQTYASFIRRSNWTKVKVPTEWMEALEPVKNDDSAVRDIGKTLIANMCRQLIAAGIKHLHLRLNWFSKSSNLPRRKIPPFNAHCPGGPPLALAEDQRMCDQYSGATGTHHTLLVPRHGTSTPNGRWTDSRSPAFGELDAYGVGLKGTNEQNIKLWGEPKSIKDISDIFVNFLTGKLDRLPWSDSPITTEAHEIQEDLLKLNQRGFLTINSQPAVNGVKSSHPVYGWGPKNGFVYQKAYLELLVPSNLIDELITRIEKNDDLTYHATNKKGELKTNTRDSPNALTWGIFAGREIIQPTIVETVSFLAWKDEAYLLGEHWSKCHDAASPSRQLIQHVMDDWYLVNIVDNDFHRSNAVFELFNGLEIKDLNVEVAGKPLTNGHAEPNGVAAN